MVMDEHNPKQWVALTGILFEMGRISVPQYQKAIDLYSINRNTMRPHKALYEALLATGHIFPSEPRLGDDEYHAILRDQEAYEALKGGD